MELLINQSVRRLTIMTELPKGKKKKKKKETDVGRRRRKELMRGLIFPLECSCVMKAMNPTYTADGHLTRSTIHGVSRRMTLADKAPLQPPSPLWCCAASR